MPEASSEDVSSGASRSLGAPFATTAWSLISLSQQQDDQASQEHLGYLIERYWRPVYFFIRQRGKAHEDAKDLTQAFFTHFIDKDVISYADQKRGKFRNFLLASLNRFLAQNHRSAAQRFFAATLTGIDTVHEFTAFEPADDDTPELVFRRNWAKSTIENCVARLREECRALGKEAQFTVFVDRLLVQEPVPQRLLAEKIGISEADVGNYLRQAKQRFRRIFRLEVLNTVLAPGDVDDEVRELLAILA